MKLNNRPTVKETKTLYLQKHEWKDVITFKWSEQKRHGPTWEYQNETKEVVIERQMNDTELIEWLNNGNCLYCCNNWAHKLNNCPNWMRERIKILESEKND